MSVMGHKQTSRDVRVTSALPPIEDIRRMSWHVRLISTANVTAALRWRISPRCSTCQYFPAQMNLVASMLSQSRWAT